MILLKNKIRVLTAENRSCKVIYEGANIFIEEGCRGEKF